MCEIPKCKCGAKAEYHNHLIRCSNKDCEYHCDYLVHEWFQEMKKEKGA